MHDFDRTQLEYESHDNFELEEEGFGYESDVFSPEEEAQLASDLLSVQTEEELDYFLGGVLKTVGNALKSPVGKAVGGVLKSAAKKALPLAGAALGSAVPGVGTAIGTALGNAASNLLETEGDDSEDLEFEGAKRFVRMTGDAIKKAAAASPRANPRTVAQAAVTAAARKHAPELLRPPSPPRSVPRPGEQSGRWIRRGNRIVLFGV